MISAQSIGEPGTQLTMRTFHRWNSITTRKSIVTKTKGTLNINTNLIEDSKKNLIVWVETLNYQ